jgi:Di-haem cytochrome c peroxidase
MAASLSELAREHRTVLGAAGAACELSKACVANVYGATAERRVLPEGTIVIAAAPIRPAWVIPTRPGLPGTVPVPAIDSGSAAIAELGRQLFTDRHLSSTGTVACATCHNPSQRDYEWLMRAAGLSGVRVVDLTPMAVRASVRMLRCLERVDAGEGWIRVSQRYLDAFLDDRLRYLLVSGSRDS